MRTAWTAIVVPMCIIAKCAIDFIGMEYGSDHQCVDDVSFFIVQCGVTAFAVMVDTRNWFGSR